MLTCISMVWTLLQLLSVTDFLTLLFPLLRAFRAQRPGRACVDKRVATIASAPWGKILRPLSPYRHMYKTNARIASQLFNARSPNMGK